MNLSNKSHYLNSFLVLILLLGSFFLVSNSINLPKLASGVQINDSDVTPGNVLYWPVMKDVVYLINEKGHKIRQWSRPPLSDWEHVELMPDGGLIALNRTRIGVHTKPSGYIVRLDKNSNVIGRSMPLPVHHEFTLLPNGNVIVLCRRYFKNKIIAGDNKLLQTDYLVELSSDLSRIVWRWELSDHLADLSRLSGIEFPLEKFDWKKRKGDWAHLNSVRRIGINKASIKNPIFSEGNLIVSSRNLSLLVIINPKTDKVVWAWGNRLLDGQHSPVMLPSGNLLVFDNGETRGFSRVIEFNPLSEQIEWQYQGTAEKAFYTERRGSVQPLDGGNLFISEGDTGRLFEINREGKIVWEFINPAITHPAVSKRERRLYKAQKYPINYLEQPKTQSIAVLQPSNASTN